MVNEEELLQELQEEQEDATQDAQEDSLLDNKEFQEAYGIPEPEQQYNQHAFLSNSLLQANPEKVTYLNEYELGRPLFNMRFLLSLEKISFHYLNDVCEELKVPNKIATYFRAKINDMAASGMSNQGFLQNLNVTKKMDMTRKRIKNIQNLKGGKKELNG